MKKAQKVPVNQKQTLKRENNVFYAGKYYKSIVKIQ